MYGAQACKPAAGGAAGIAVGGAPEAAASKRAAKLAAYEWEVKRRTEHVRRHGAALSMVDVWELTAPLWNCDGPRERVGFFLDGGMFDQACVGNFRVA